MATRRKPHPMQPIVVAQDKVIRFKANKVVRWLVDLMSEGHVKADGRPFNLNNIATHVQLAGWDPEEAEQFWQLMGYSVSGYGELSFIRRKVVHRADAIAEGIRKRLGRRLR